MAFLLHLKKSIIIIITQHITLLVFCIEVFSIQNIPEDDNFYLVCRHNQSLTPVLHYNTCPMEHLDRENLSLCILSTFSTCHGRTCLLFLSVLLPVFQIDVTQPHSKPFHTESSRLFLRDIEQHCIGRVFIVLWHAITKYIFRCLDKPWYNCFPINLITYNTTTVLSIIA